MANAYKRIIDRSIWAMAAPTPNAHAAGGGMACDMRNDFSRNPFAFQLVSNTVLNRYNFVTKSWQFVGSPALGGTFGAGAGCVFLPSHAVVGTVGSGSTTTSVVTSALFTAAPGVNMLANRGGSGDYGYKVRITGLVAGKVEERWIIGNTGTTTPTLLLDSALSFSPSSGDTVEILSGQILINGAGALAANILKSFSIAENVFTVKTYTNMPATIGTDYAAVALDEQYVPYDHKPGEGFVIGAGTYDTGNSKGCLIATASASGTLTGQASAGDATVLANEYRNFQIRIVEDTGTPAAVGQRRIIASHTAGASPVYTLGTAWATTPSSTAKFVIEYPNLLLLRSTATAVVYTYNYGKATVNNGTNSIAADAWHVTYFGNASGVMGAGCTFIPAFGIEPDTAKYSRHSHIFCFRGGNSTVCDLLDIAGSITGTWTSTITYDGSGSVSFNTGSCGKYAPGDQDGRFAYINGYVASAISQIYRFDVKNRVLSTHCPTDWIQAGTAAAGDRVATTVAIDGSDKYTVVLLLAHLSNITQELIIQV